jgi:hypothetical protein
LKIALQTRLDRIWGRETAILCSPRIIPACATSPRGMIVWDGCYGLVDVLR